MALATNAGFQVVDAAGRSLGWLPPSLGRVIMYVRDLAASIAFYRDVVGLALKFEDAGYAECGTEPARFALYDQRRPGWPATPPRAAGRAPL